MLALGARGHEFDSRKSPRPFLNRKSVQIFFLKIIRKLGRKSGRFTNPFVWTGPGENIFSKSSFVTYVDVDTVCLEKLSFFIFKIIRGT